MGRWTLVDDDDYGCLLTMQFLSVHFGNCQALISKYTFELLPPAYQSRLIQLLPTCDQIPASDTPQTYVIRHLMCALLVCWLMRLIPGSC